MKRARIRKETRMGEASKAGALALEWEDVVEDLQSTIGLLHQLAGLAPAIAGEGGTNVEEEDL
jgi:hypothetical protein